MSQQDTPVVTGVTARALDTIRFSEATLEIDAMHQRWSNGETLTREEVGLAVEAARFWRREFGLTYERWARLVEQTTQP